MGSIDVNGANPREMRCGARELRLVAVEISELDATNQFALIIEAQDFQLQIAFSWDEIHAVVGDSEGLAVIRHEQPSMPALYRPKYFGIGLSDDDSPVGGRIGFGTYRIGLRAGVDSLWRRQWSVGVRQRHEQEECCGSVTHGYEHGA